MWLVMLVMGDGAAASGISSSVDAEGEVVSGLAALSGGRVTPRVGTAGPAAAPSAMTCVIVARGLCVWVGTTGRRREAIFRPPRCRVSLPPVSKAQTAEPLEIRARVRFVYHWRHLLCVSRISLACQPCPSPDT